MSTPVVASGSGKESETTQPSGSADAAVDNSSHTTGPPQASATAGEGAGTGVGVGAGAGAGAGAGGDAGSGAGGGGSDEGVYSRRGACADDEPPVYITKHANYVKCVSQEKDTMLYAVTEHLRMSGVYWGLCAMEIMQRGGDMPKDDIANWVMECFDAESGGFGGNAGHDPHMLYTLSAVQLMALCDQLHRVDAEKVATYIAGLQQADGSFFGDKWGEVDTRFSYCALNCLALLGKLEAVDVAKATDYVASCKNFDGGFGCTPGAESHAGQVFCCVGALAIGGALHHVDADLLGWWLAERQCDSGGLNGRPEKQADVCYSWWILSALAILGRIDWIDTSKLVRFILKCQDADDGGISERPGNMADVFHTFFGVAGLALLGHLDATGAPHTPIDPAFALPVPLVTKLGLRSQTVAPPSRSLAAKPDDAAPCES